MAAGTAGTNSDFFRLVITIVTYIPFGILMIIKAYGTVRTRGYHTTLLANSHG
jgi:hypothetical protein